MKPAERAKSTSEAAVCFGCGTSAPDLAAEADLAAKLGGKGAGLVRMSIGGIPVPPGFVLPTSTCHHYLANGWATDHETAMTDGLVAIGRELGRELGDPDRPLLVSIRSGAPVSMPGMMDTVLNAGMTSAIAQRLSTEHADESFGWNTYLRFVRCFADVVLEAPKELLDSLATPGHHDTPETVAATLAALTTAGYPVPDEPIDQVRASAQAVFASWNAERAKFYRERQGISDDLGTAVTIQAMVFGNRPGISGTGVAFSRDPATGTPALMGDFLANAQGEDVVAGTHATLTLADMARLWPELGAQLASVVDGLERSASDMVDVEFTIDDGRLWILQSRVGKRSPAAALRIAVDMADDPSFPLDRATAVARVAPVIEAAEVTSLADDLDIDTLDVLGRGLAASPGVAVGTVVTDVDDAVERSAAGERVILFRPETSPHDIHGMAAAAGLVTTSGGMVSHAAVVAREWGLPAVVGVADLGIEGDHVRGATMSAEVGDTVTIDGGRGVVILGEHAGSSRRSAAEATLIAWRTEFDQQVSPDAVAPDAAQTAVVDEAAILRHLSIKGMATAAALAEVLLAPAEAAQDALDAAVAAGLAEAAAGERMRLTTAGTEAANAGFAQESAKAAAAIEPHIGGFHALDARFKGVVTAWQVRPVDGADQPNDHADADYDTSVIADLRGIDAEAGPLLDEIAAELPRLGSYGPRFARALAAIEAGDNSMVAHPFKDSYHTAWFELHEELIRLTGRNRADL